MTIIFSTASSIMATIAVDSTITLNFKDHKEYPSGRKLYRYPGVGCVGTWGERDGNILGQHLEKCDIKPDNCDIYRLADLVEKFLKEKFRPDNISLGDVGYHVVGFDNNQRPKLFHIFWGYDQPKQENQFAPKYARNDHSPELDSVSLLYNGRNDLAHNMINLLIDQIRRNKIVKYDLRDPITQIIIGDFIARFSAEISPEVGPPFITSLISPKNQLGSISNKSYCPLSIKSVKKLINEIDWDDPTLKERINSL